MDTNIILAAWDAHCWPAISNYYELETVEKCVEETLTHNPNDPRHIKMPAGDLYSGIRQRHNVTKLDIANLILNGHCGATLDDDEQQLLAWLYCHEVLPSNVIRIATADKAAIMVANQLGWLDAVTSLEELATQAGVAKTNLNQLKSQYSKSWLTSARTQIRLGVLK